MTPNDDGVAEVLALEAQRIEAMKAGDAAALDALLAEELVYTHSRASVDDKASYLMAVAASKMRYAEILRDELRAARHGDTVIISARVRMRVESADGTMLLDNRGLSVWSRAGGPWQFLAWQATPIVAR